MATASRKKAGTSVALWDEKLAARAARAKKAEASVVVGGFIGTKGGILTYQGNAVPGNSMQVVVLDSILENNLFVGKYNPDAPQSPVCYAFGRDDDEMVPHADSTDPQCESCAGCQHNEWGSAEEGRGKACKNIRRLAMIPADALDAGATGVADAEVAYLKLPVTSVKAWAGYVNQLSGLNKPPLAFVTELSIVPDPKTQFKIQFSAVEEIDDGDLLGALLDRGDAEEERIAFPYQAVEEPAARPSSRKPARSPAKAPARAPAKAPARKTSVPAPASGRRKF